MIDTCPNGHPLKKIGHSCCDDICECECGKWFVCGLGSIWPADTQTHVADKKLGLKIIWDKN